MKAWIVATPDIEYNDETYYTTENNGINAPSKVYLSGEQAKETCKAANLELLNDYHIGSFGRSLGELTSLDKEDITRKLTILEIDIPDDLIDISDNIRGIGDNIKLEVLALYDKIPVSTVREIELIGSNHDLINKYSEE